MFPNSLSSTLSPLFRELIKHSLKYNSPLSEYICHYDIVGGVAGSRAQVARVESEVLTKQDTIASKSFALF